jgi:poly(3-hydroxybutyrate) depolymerase
MILVSAANSGNGAGVLNRREPLALLAAENIMRSYPLDPERVYIGGFSGGSRMALRIARGYPDVFHGALLNAGSDPIGNAQIPLPPQELLRQFQESTRVVYVTGAHDNFNLAAVRRESTVAAAMVRV